MIDESDLYAQGIPVEIDGMAVSGGELIAGAQFGSPRPRRTIVETATDLDAFEANVTAEEIAGAMRDRASFVVDTEDADRLLLRIRASARR